ncbi:putative bifunctional diguanylate cyclase/phosphodiesterase [Afipia sp. TerB]
MWPYLSKLFAGDLAAFGGPQTKEEAAGYIRAEQMAMVLRHSPSTLLANACNATVLAIGLWQSPDRPVVVLWAAVVVCFAMYFGIKARVSWRVTRPQFVSRRAIHRLLRNAVLFGIAWGIVPAAFFANAGNGGQLIITCLSAGMLAGGALTFATIPVAAIAFTGPIFIGTAICLLQHGDFVYLLVAILVVVYGSMLLRGVFSYAFEFTRRLVRQLETEKAVRQDPLTQLPNRFAFNERLDKGISQLARSGDGFALLLIDLDGFKEVNDQFGHPTGDEFLLQIAKRLRRCARDADTIARIGGDEFAMIVPNLTEPDQVYAIAAQITAVFSEPFVVEQREIIGSASVGIVLAPRDGRSSNELLKHADMALYRAKKDETGNVQFFEASDSVSARERMALLHDLERAIERDEFFLVYQPILDLRENRIAGFEALLRWQHPVRGLVPPDEFIPVAEQSGLIHSIGEWVIRRACLALSHWPKDLRIAVNFSATQFQNANVLQTIVSALADAGIPPARLEIEMTESTLISKYGSAPSILNSLLELGATISLDDFGTGYSSLTYLRKLPFSRIKIDQSFVRDMLAQPDCAAIVKSVIGLAQELQMGVIAEGVETEEQLDYLRRTNCDEAQGHLIGRPIPFDQVSALLGNDNRAAGHAA